VVLRALGRAGGRTAWRDGLEPRTDCRVQSARSGYTTNSGRGRPVVRPPGTGSATLSNGGIPLDQPGIEFRAQGSGPMTTERRSLSQPTSAGLDPRVRCPAMLAWQALEQAEPEFAGRVRRLFDAGRHKTIATLRADGSPRISGIECEFTDSDLRFGSMTGARKGADLERDPRFALHGPTFHPEEGKESDWPGEAKIAGRAIPAGPVPTDEATEQPDGEMFVADITEVVITGLNAEATKLVVESWTPERGLRRVERE
jgi:hypothetical protein